MTPQYKEWPRIALGMICVLAAQLSTATAVMDADQILKAAEAAVRAAAGTPAPGTAATAAGTNSSLVVHSSPLDPRLRLAACDQALQAFVTGDGQLRRQNTVGVRCEGSVHWTIYTTVMVDSEFAVLVARRPLSTADTLSIADFQVETRRVPGLAANYVTDPQALVGQRLRRALLAGEAVSFDALAPAVLIHRGQEVELLARADGFEVRMAGIALSDGGADERIRVENLSSQHIVEGIVRSDHLVEAPL